MKHLSLWLHFAIDVAATQKHLTVWSSCPTEETDFSNKLVLVFSWNKKWVTMPIILQEAITACYHTSCASPDTGEIMCNHMMINTQSNAVKFQQVKMKFSNKLRGVHVVGCIVFFFSKILNNEGLETKETENQRRLRSHFLNLNFILNFNRFTAIQSSCQSKWCWITVLRSLLHQIMTSRQPHKWTLFASQKYFQNKALALIEF